MSVYFKATRPDGTSFHDHSTRWVVGKITRLAPTRDGLPYLSVSTVATDCTGFSWPCRLFEVRPVRGHKVTTPNADLPNKRGSDAWMVVRELPAHDVFGPHGVQVAALIERARTLTTHEVERLYAAWDAAGYAAWDAAGYAAWGAAWDAAWHAARDARYAAWHARDAALGLVCRDLITTEQYDTLTLPWRQVIGRIHPDDPEVKNR